MRERERYRDERDQLLTNVISPSGTSSTKLSSFEVKFKLIPPVKR